MSSLRERRRQRTTDSVRRAAVEAVYKHGLEKVTTEMISEAAGISPRTFFNYFPYKEAALAPPPLVFSPASLDQFVQGKGTLLDDIAILLSTQFDEFSEDRDHLRKAHEISMSNPKLLALRTSAFYEFEDLLAELIANRSGQSKSTDETRHMAALVAATMRVCFISWLEQGSDSAASSMLSRVKAIKTLFDHN